MGLQKGKMTKMLITIDVESSKEVRDGVMHHLHYKEDIERPCKRIIKIADKYGAKGNIHGATE